MTYRSKFEANVASALKKKKIRFGYETKTLKFVQPAKNRKYTPDFELHDISTFVECKGRLTQFDREKLILAKEANPDVPVILLFQNSDVKIRKGSPTSYGMWATKNGFEWYDFRQGIPNKWKGKE